jgi:hypothetical protein
VAQDVVVFDQHDIQVGFSGIHNTNLTNRSEGA